MNQQDIDTEEWNNPDNWSGPAWLCFYFSKQDSRTWVPKRIPSLGWTLNLGKNAGVFWLTGFLLDIPLAVAAVLL